MKIIVGLGNPGNRYRHTPHNIGFAVVEELASEWVCVLKRSFRLSARIGKTFYGAEKEKILLVEPQAYMNNSGSTVIRMLKYWKLDLSDIIVVLDDADLDLGHIRIRARGGSGGHKGLESIINLTGSEEFIRVRLGIGRNNARGGLTEHVLAPFSSEEKKDAQKMVQYAARAVQSILESGVDAAMAEFNRRLNTDNKQIKKIKKDQ
ncbi:aminoacyl-tRNA hydrolase [Verrucomicrobiota bacterium]